MKTFRILIDTSNEAFGDNVFQTQQEIGYMLDKLAGKAYEGTLDLEHGEALLDHNGNIVGRAQMIGDEH